MNICYVLSTSETSGGANKSFIELLKNIDRNEVVPFVILRRKGNIEGTLRDMNVKYTIVPFLNAVTTGNKVKDLLKKIFMNRGLHRIKKYYIDNNIDLVHNNSMPALLGMEAAMKCSIPYICHIREDVEKGLGVGFLNKKKHFKVVNKAAKIIVISNFIKDSYSRYIPEMQVLYDGMDVNRYYVKKEILGSDVINVSIYGNLDEQKNQMVAVKAMEKLRKNYIDNIVLNIIGNQDTKYGMYVKKYVTGKRIRNVNLIDNIVDFDKLTAARKKDDINLICSRAEGLGRVTIESMLSGNLTIGADAGATREILNDGNTGLLFESGNSDALAKLLKKVSSERDKMMLIAKNGQDYALKTFDIERYTEEIVKVYKDIYSR